MFEVVRNHFEGFWWHSRVTIITVPQKIDHSQRKALLAEAAFRVIHKHGISTLSIRTVAAEAGVSSSSLRHIFPKREDLLAGAAEHLVSEVHHRVSQHVASYQEKTSTEKLRKSALANRDAAIELAMASLEEVLPLDHLRRTEMTVNIALMAESAASPALRRIRDEINQGIQGLCTNLAEEIHRFDPLSPRKDLVNLTATTLHVTADGLAFHLMHQDADAKTNWAVRHLRSTIDNLTTPRGQSANPHNLS